MEIFEKMIKIYEIPKADLVRIKEILEQEEKPLEELDVEIEFGHGKEKGKAKASAWSINEFRTNGYILREASAFGIKKDCSYLYIEASEDFFKKNEKILLENGAKLLKGDEFEKVKQKIQEQESNVEESLGVLFG